MNVYDFDGTIYNGDSTIDLYQFLLKRRPSILRHLPAFCIATGKHKIGKMPTKEWKEVFFRFLSDIPDLGSELWLFWKHNFRKIMPWYLAQRRADDVIISASPEFLLAIPAKKLKIQTLIASRVDRKTGKFFGKNCKGSEKVRRFREIYPNDRIDCFYSDSRSDLPMAKLAERAFLCNRGHLTQWDARKGVL